MKYIAFATALFLTNAIFAGTANANDYGGWNPLFGCDASYRVTRPEKNEYSGKYESKYELKNTALGKNRVCYTYRPTTDFGGGKRACWTFRERNETNSFSAGGFEYSSRLTLECAN